MIALYDHIQELRAELRGCYMTHHERAAVQAELARAVVEQAELDRAFDRALAVLQAPGGGRRLSGSSLSLSAPVRPAADGTPHFARAGLPSMASTIEDPPFDGREDG